MADSSGRRIYLDPIFESFDFLDVEPVSQPHGTNGYHVASSYDEELILFGGLGSQSVDSGTAAGTNGAEPSATPNGTISNGAISNGAISNGAASNGADLNRAVTNGADLNGADLNGTDLNGTDLNGTDLNGTDLNGTDLNGTDLNGTASHSDSASESQNGQPPAEGTLTKGAATNGDMFVAHSAPESAPTLPSVSDADAFAAAASEADFQVIDLGHESHLEMESTALEEMPVLDEQPVDAEDASVADTLDADTLGSPAAELVDSHTELPAADASASAATAPSTSDAHPAAGSMFVPYLVTEIRELRGRGSRQRSWWRRLFG